MDLLHSWTFWILFNLGIGIALVIDLISFRAGKSVPVKKAIFWSLIWISLALIFNGWLWLEFGHDVALQFFTCYITEKSLSFDNLFVFYLIFSYFKVRGDRQHKVLFLGILGALAMRLIFILAGLSLIHRFEWIHYVFGAILAYSGIRLFLETKKEFDPDENMILRWIKGHMRIATTKELETVPNSDSRFTVRIGGKWMMTPLMFTLITVELSDLIFAVDSIPAVLAISSIPIIVYSSNAFAILGLRSLYFVMADLVERFFLLHYGLGLILVGIGAKMLIQDWFYISTTVSLAFIATVLVASVLVSIFLSKRHPS
jgi:tellurite resistance protein TerC